MDFVIFAVNFLFSVYYILLGLRAILPWFSHNRMHPLINPVYRVTDPYLNPIRAGLPPLRIGIDVSPFVGIILLWLAQKIILYFIG